jgi:hypothetical protein
LEYFREPHNKIQAGFALHVGKLLAQYISTFKLPPDDYEATLLICVVQSLLTVCSELINATKKHRSELWSAPIHDVPPWLGISRSFVKRDTFYPCELTHGRFIEHLRNAVSHPTSSEKEPYYPSTGYTTLLDGSGIIARFLFIDSPWVDRGKIHSRFCSLDEQRTRECAKTFERRYALSGLTVERNLRGRYEIRRDNELYLPVFQAELTIASLRSLAIELANYLAQPTTENWDGRTIHRLVA